MRQVAAGERVLVVYDEPTVRLLVCDVLGDLAYTAVEAADSAQGPRLLRSDVRITGFAENTLLQQRPAGAGG